MNHLAMPLHKPSVLIVDDAPDNLTLLTHLLEGEEYDVRIAPGGRFALQSVREDAPDLILLDIQMPDLDGFEVCRALKEDDATRDIPIIFLTAVSSTEDEGRGLELGAVDYITKPFNARIVRARVRNHMRYIRQRKLLEQLVQLDPLTEILNRRGFGAAMEREWNRALRERAPLSLAVLDVDHFKQFNDRRGHLHGDRALRAVAGALLGCARRPTDVVARYGGDEFVVLLPGTGENGAFLIAEQMRVAVGHLDLGNRLTGDSINLTLTVGGATVVPTVERDAAMLIKDADANLYRAKLSGRNQVVWSSIDA